jgi:hypothetical protein
MLVIQALLIILLLDCSAQVTANIPSTLTAGTKAIATPYGSLFQGSNVGCTNSGSATLAVGPSGGDFSVVMWVNIFDVTATQYNLLTSNQHIGISSVNTNITLLPQLMRRCLLSLVVDKYKYH